MSTFLTEPKWYDTNGELITPKKVKVNNASQADSATNADTAQKADSLQISDVYYTFLFDGNSTLVINKVVNGVD